MDLALGLLRLALILTVVDGYLTLCLAGVLWLEIDR